jgi:hypothetical protein
MNRKLTLKYIATALIGAILFGAFGYAYGSIVANNACNKYWMNQANKCGVKLLNEESRTISTDDTSDKPDYLKYNLSLPDDFKPLPVNIT